MNIEKRLGRYIMNKVKKIELILPEINDKIENTRQILWTLQSECRLAANRTVQYLWEWNGLSSDYKKEYDHFPDKEEIAKLLSGKNGIDTYAYAKIVPECQCLSTKSISTIIRDVKGKYMKVIGDILKGNRSIPSFRSNYPIPVEKQSYALSHVVKYDNNGHSCDEDYYIDVGILSRAGAERFDTGTRLRFKLRVSNGRDKSLKSFLKQCKNIKELSEIDGKVTENGSCCEEKRFILTSSSISFDERNKKWMLNLGYSFESAQIKYIEGKQVGVQLGYIVPVYCAVNDGLERFCIRENEIEEFRKRTESRRIALRHHTAYCGDGSIGHGRQTRCKGPEKIGEIISNFKDTCNHKYSRAIINFAVSQKAEYIVIENLSGISEENLFLKRWSYYDLQSKIKYKAAEAGIKVKVIDPQYTSRRCYKCGHINVEENNSDEKRMFICEECGSRTTYDYNAAKNIAEPDIEKIISNQIKVQDLIKVSKRK